jgi:hypothetical protein
MDESVKQAMAKWPNVPACTGWLALDRRGVWRMRDEAAQQAGTAGTPIRHDALNGFINRNYAADESGCWFFQNGPQRVYIELAYTPWVVRLQRENGVLRLTDQTGAEFLPQAGWLDDAGAVLFSDEAQRIALLHDHDLDLFSESARFVDDDTQAGSLAWRENHILALKSICAAQVAEQFHFVASPAATRGPGQSSAEQTAHGSTRGSAHESAKVAAPTQGSAQAPAAAEVSAATANPTDPAQNAG